MCSLCLPPCWYTRTASAFQSGLESQRCCPSYEELGVIIILCEANFQYVLPCKMCQRKVLALDVPVVVHVPLQLWIDQEKGGMGHKLASEAVDHECLAVSTGPSDIKGYPGVVNPRQVLYTGWVSCSDRAESLSVLWCEDP